MRKIYIAESGQGRYRHLFGGVGWRTAAGGNPTPPPILVLTLDASDARVGLAVPPGISGIPLCTRVDVETPARQAYVFDPIERTVAFEGPSWHVEHDPGVPLSLPERALTLRSLRPSEEASADDAPGTLVGSAGFLRIGGEPLWLGDPEEVYCTCDRRAQFIAIVGYENQGRPSGVMPNGEAFFLGEMALYYFGCFPCRRIVAVAQSS